MIKYRIFDDGDPENLWAHWYREKTDKRDRNKHSVVFRMLEQQDPRLWGSPHFRDDLKDGLTEIKISATKEWRLLGTFHPDKFTYTVLLICSHKDKRYQPQSAIDTARDRLKDINDGTAVSIPCDRPDAPDRAAG
jgi:hypothetical protein